MITDMLFVMDSQNESISKTLFLDDSLIDVNSFYKTKVPTEWGLTSFDYPLFLALQVIEKKLHSKSYIGIVINLSIGDKSTSKNSAIDLAIYLRLNKLPLPIFIISESELIVSNRLTIPPKSYEAMIDYSVGKFLTFNQAFNKNASLNGNYPIYEYLNNEFNLASFLDNFIVSQPDNRHQITNEWGAVKLALNAGYTSNKISYKFPETLYFKYLEIKYPHNSLSVEERQLFFDEKDYDFPSDKVDIASLLKKNKILLIDDNAEKGWKSVLEKIFNCIITSKTTIRDTLDISDYEEYDIVFLDLYLPNPLMDDNIDMQHSITILESIKKAYPQIPIIVFTASNKSWTLHEVIDRGADGMYVKEAPDYAGNSMYSKENFKNFMQTVVSCLNKYKILRPYWEAIQTILNDSTFQSIEEKGNSKFKERIKERLEMFFGLLKRGFEETKYNKEQFHFSDYELAFMTLWSILNEISEANYVKTQPLLTIVDSSSNLINLHPGGQNIVYKPNNYKWEILKQSDIFIEYDCQITKDSFGNFETNASGRYFKLSYEQQSPLEFKNNIFSITQTKKTKTNYETTLFLQIAYLLERKNNLSANTNKLAFQNILVSLNETRNHLYLTHGAEISTGFYYKTEKDKRSTHNIKPDKDIKNLFELVSFLITGIENKVIL